jgi:uridine kinase
MITMTPLVTIGIAGGTGAGKTTLVQRLVDHFQDVSVVDLDSYYRDRSDVSPQDREHLNFDEPSAVDLPLLLRQLTCLRHGRVVQKPIYSFATHCRAGSYELQPSSLLVVEGLFVLCWQELRTLLDLKVYLEAPADVRLVRRLRRDVRERGRTVESVLDQYVNAVRIMHEQFVEPTRQHADIILTHTGHSDDNFRALLDTLKTLAPIVLPPAAP